MKRVGLFSILICACCAQIDPQTGRPPVNPEADPKLPNGKSQHEELIKDDYRRNLADAQQLARLADDLKSELEKGDKNIISVKNIKQTEEIEKLARGIRARLKRY